MKKILFFVLVLVVCATVAMAQDAPPAGGPPAGGTQSGYRGGFQRGGFGFGMGGPAMAVMPPTAQMVSRLATSLSLTQDQQDKLTGILTKSETSLAALRTKMTDASTALREAVLAKTYDAAKVTAALAAAQKAESDLITAELQTWSDIRGVLTADQQEKLSTAVGRSGFGGGTRGGGYRGGRGNNPPPGGPVPPPVPPPAPAEAPAPAPAN